MTQTDNASLSYIALALTPGVGRVRFKALVDHFGGPEAVLSASQADLCQVYGAGPNVAAAISGASVARAEAVLRACDRLDTVFLLPDDDDFPDALRSIPDSPLLLFARGKLNVLRQPAVAVVGSRVHSSYGREACERLVSALASAGLVVVSGMARGLDAVAHWTALNVGGTSIGVLGNGHGVVYPRANLKLYDRMLERGCLLTERPPEERPSAGSFPERNRLISGLARATLVVEARRNSGALITAQCALEQGREVMAVPGPITGPLSLGTNRLIQLGAKPVVEARDVLEEFGLADGIPRVSLPADLTESERCVLELLGDGSRHVDDLAVQTRTDMTDLLPVLTALEIRGLVSQQSAMQYSLTSLYIQT